MFENNESPILAVKDAIFVVAISESPAVDCLEHSVDLKYKK